MDKKSLHDECRRYYSKLAKELAERQKPTVTRKDFEYMVHDIHCASSMDNALKATKEWFKEFGMEVAS